MASSSTSTTPNLSTQWKCGEGYQYPLTPDKDHWESLLNPLLEQDAEQCKAWREEVTNLLLFSGLFGAVLAAFIVVSYPTLHVHPSIEPDSDAAMIGLLRHIASRLDTIANVTSAHPIDAESLSSSSVPSIVINALWFTSLVLSLSTALIGIVSLQWLTEHERYPSALSSQEKFALFHMRAEGLRTWCVPQIFAILPLLLQLSLVLFFAGLIGFLLLSSLAVAIPVITIIVISLLFLLVTTVVPALQMFAFCLPLGYRKEAPPQCPYKSPQSKAFQRIIIYSGSLIRFYFHFVKSLNKIHYNISWYFGGGKARQGPLVDPSGLEFLLAAIFEARNAKSWVAFDLSWLVLRDACARCIFEGSGYINEFHATCLAKIGPLYDSARAVYSLISEYRGDANMSKTYFCLDDLTSLAITGQTTADAYGNNRYLQNVLFSADLKKGLSTFSDYFDDPSSEFMQDENRFIFLSRHPHLSPNHLRHFAELHVRMMNYLYIQSPPRSTKSNLPSERPTYPNVHLLNFYSMKNTDEQVQFFDDHIHSQFSSVVDAFFTIASDNNVSEIDLLRSFYGQPFGAMFQSLAIGQPKKSASDTLRTLALAMKILFAQNPGRRSDYLFYAAAFYARAHWLESDTDEWDQNEHAKDLVTALHTYANSDHNRDRELGKRLGIPDSHDLWWEFLNT
ncbi:hypothetical protein CVT26_010623 [Gymnopilus dilepis]|uniref:DUF6535 domain-containing protein n=1 Tax=Gymnopilus dilepis TaxID=231916 RepID=A0A409W567_9AGAR|nr:hypothetical protein CVT26_010623 [Gymnopilus dilepis]